MICEEASNNCLKKSMTWNELLLELLFKCQCQRFDSFKNSLALLPDIKKILIERKTDYLQNLATNLDTLEDVIIF